MNIPRYDNEILSKQEYTAMKPAENVNPARFYALLKINKEYEHGEAPQFREIFSCSGTFSENIATYVDHLLKDLGNLHPSYLQDTPDFCASCYILTRENPFLTM